MKLQLFLLLSALCSSTLVLAETGHGHEEALSSKASMTLHDVVEITYQRNPQLGVIQARLEHVDALSKRARSLWATDPTLSVNHYNDQLMDSNGLREWEVGIEMPLWLPGQKAAQMKTAEQQRLLVSASEPALKLRIASIVRELVWNIALAKNRMLLFEREHKEVKRLAEDVRKRVVLGDLAESDLLLAQQESLSKEAAWNTANQEFAHAQHRYTVITDLNFLPQVYEETVVGDLSISFDHPALQELNEKVSHSAARRDQVKLEKGGNPSLFLGTRHEQAMSNNGFTNAIGLSFKMPLGLAAHTRPKVTAAEVNLAENRSQQEVLYRQLNMTIQDASLELSATQDQYEFARRQNELAKTNLARSRKAFSLGETSLIELIRIQAQAFAVESNMHQKQLEVGLHTARLNQAKGIIP